MNIEHILPLARSGNSQANNLCLACAWCNSYQWAKTHSIDLQSKEEVSLFHPRKQKWQEHFQWRKDGVYMIGIIAIGRATIGSSSLGGSRLASATNVITRNAQSQTGKLRLLIHKTQKQTYMRFAYRSVHCVELRACCPVISNLQLI